MSQFDKLYTSREKLVKTVMDLTENVNRISGEVNTKQDTLVSGESIKTVNGESLLGSGGLAISGETLVVDETPTSGSDNLVKSGGVKEELVLGSVYDVSAHNSGTTFASLSALLSSQSLSSLIPTAVRKGGMSIKFVLTSDNNYVQFRYMPSDAATVATFTNVANWQGVDAEPTEDSKNLVESGGVALLINGGIRTIDRQSIDTQTELTDKLSGFLRSNSGTWSWYYGSGNGDTAFISISNLGITPTYLKVKADTTTSQIAFLKEKLPTSNVNNSTLKSTYIADNGGVYNNVSYPFHVIPENSTQLLEIPSGTNYISVKLSTSSYNYTPVSIEFIVGQIVTGVVEKLGDITQLETEVKTSAVAAINEVNSNSGVIGFTDTGKTVVISDGFGNINTRIPTSVAGKKGYKYRITCDNTAGSSTASWRLYENTSESHVATNDSSAGVKRTTIFESQDDCTQFYVSCNKSNAVITIEVLGTNEDMFPIDLRNVGIEQGGLTGNSDGNAVTKYPNENLVRLKTKIPAIKRDFNGLRCWFANIPPSVVRDGQDYSGYSWHYKCYFLNSQGNAVGAVGNWQKMTDDYTNAYNYDAITNRRNATDIWMHFAFTDGTNFAPITPDDIPFGTLRMVMGKDYSNVVNTLLSNDIEALKTYFDVKDLRYVDYGGINGSGIVDSSSVECFYTPSFFTIKDGKIEVKTSVRSDGKALLWRVAFYDKNKTYISTSGSYAAPSNMTAPNGARFFRLSFLMQENGSTVQTTSADLEYGELLITMSDDSVTSQLKDISTTLYDSKLVNSDPNKIYLIRASKEAADNYGMNTNGTNFPTLFVTTDVHSQWNYPNWRSTLEDTLDYGNTIPEINLMMMLGDLDDNPNTLGNKNWKQLVLSQDKPLLAVAGNHEVYKSTSWTDSGSFQGFTDATLFDYFYNSDTITKCGEVHGGTNNDKPYYYKDLDAVTYQANEQGDKVTKTFKLRLICLYQYEYVTPTDATTGAPLNNYKSQYKVFSQDQIDWLLDVLDSCDVNTHVMVIAHEPICTGMKPVDMDWNCTTPDYTTRSEVNNMSDNLIIPKIIDAWVNGTTVQTTCNMNVGNPSETYVTVSVNHTFQSAHNNKFVCYLGGHVHADYIVAHDDYPKQIQILLNCTNNSFSQQNGELYRNSGKHLLSGTAITYIPLDKTLRRETPTKREIRLIHVGADKRYNMKDSIMTNVLLDSY